MAKVSFDGENKLINVLTGITSLDIKEDVYSEWKAWVAESDNAKFVCAFSAIGGDTIRAGVYLGSTFFLENGWKLKPWTGDYELTVTGNVYTRDGSPCFVSADGSCNIMITMSKSNLIDTIATGGSSIDPEDIADAVWDKQTSTITSSGSMGKLVKDTSSNVEDNIALTIAGMSS